jgi:ketosteroid isomerase-like protein
VNNDNVAAVRNAYAVAERKDLEGWINLFTPDGVFVDNSVGATCRGRAPRRPGPQLRRGVFQHAPRAISHLCRWQCRCGATGPAGTHDGPLQLPFGELPATGKRMDAPCCDVFELEDGKIKRFDCYPEGSIIFAQLGVLNNLDAALSH